MEGQCRVSSAREPDRDRPGGFDGLICRGLLVELMLCEVGDQVGWLAAGVSFRLFKPAYFGDTLTRLEGSRREEAEAAFVHQQQVEIGFALLSGLPPVGREWVLLRTAATP